MDLTPGTSTEGIQYRDITPTVEEGPKGTAGAARQPGHQRWQREVTSTPRPEGLREEVFPEPKVRSTGQCRVRGYRVGARNTGDRQLPPRQFRKQKEGEPSQCLPFSLPPASFLSASHWQTPAGSQQGRKPGKCRASPL